MVHVTSSKRWLRRCLLLAPAITIASIALAQSNFGERGGAAARAEAAAQIQTTAPATTRFDSISPSANIATDFAQRTADKQSVRTGAVSRHRGFEVVEFVTPTSFDGDVRDLPQVKAPQPGDPLDVRGQERGDPPSLPAAPRNRTSEDPDPLLEHQRTALRAPDQRAFITPELTIQGQTTTARPPDVNGDVGSDYFIQTVNGAGGTQFTVYNKSDGSIESGPTAMSSLADSGTACRTRARGDAIVIYDSLAERWMLTEFTTSAVTPFFLCVYVSRTSNPVTGGWHVYQFNRGTTFPDYPKYGVWPNSYVIASNQSAGPALFALERPKMLEGEPASLAGTSLSNLPNYGGFQLFLPADADGPLSPAATSRPIFMRHIDDEVTTPATNDPTRDFLEIWELDLDWSMISNSFFERQSNLAIAEFDTTLCLGNVECLQQPGGQGLDPLREVLMWRLQYRNFGARETLVGNLATDARHNDRSSIRWFQLQRENGASWEVFQEGTYGPDSNHRWMGSAAMDISGNIALGFSETGNTLFPSVSYTGRLATDPLGVMSQSETQVFAGGSSQTNGGSLGRWRWGDYSSTSVDPVDDCTFWHTNAFTGANSNTLTGITAFRFDSCGGEPGFCGDGVMSAGEACDDGNPDNGDGCSASCDVELGYTCEIPAPTTEPVIYDGELELGSDNNFWTERTTNGDPIVCTEATCGFDGASTGSGWAFFGGDTSDTPTEYYLSQYVIIPESATSISFDARLERCGNPNDLFQIFIDGFGSNIKAPDDSNCGETGYRTFAVPLTFFGSNINDGQSHRIRFFARTTSIEGVESAFFLDNVQINRTQEQPSGCTQRDVCFAEDFDPGVTGDLTALGWSSVAIAGSSMVWGTTDDGVCGSVNSAPGNFTNGFGQAACVDSDAAGNIGEQAALMCSPRIDLTTSSGSKLDFNYNFQIFSDSGEDAFIAFAGTEAPIDNIDNYTAVFAQEAASAGVFQEPSGVDVSVDLSAFDGEPEVWVCFGYIANFDWYAQVDDVAITAQSCALPDSDGDGVPDTLDNCTTLANPAQLDTDGDGYGNRCDADFDDSCVVNVVDLGIFRALFFGSNNEADLDGNGVTNVVDLGILRTLFFQPPGPSGLTQGCGGIPDVVDVYYDEAQWSAALESQVEAIDTTAANIASSVEVFDPPAANAQLCAPESAEECTLTFRSINTGLCHDFDLRVFGGVTFNDNEFSPPLPDTLSIGDINNEENDDFELRNAGGEPFEGIGFYLNQNDNNAGESLTVFGENGQVLRTLDESEIPTNTATGSTFIGFVSSQPIGRIFFDEDPGGDDIAIRDFRFDNCQ